ncbi:Sarcolemmal membrane-associated protein [Acropora cervicornis]|uniref:Sarcolemmal membrane-associated protein n=1 Tax=Acropora cervicornis TaxID=6130 RepID=A0AAD9R1R6_ACRCE|nr:Sarcolemmal membrane-associated protein [Acropora cervicornis]
MAMAIFTSRPNSHPFEERTVTLREAVKIGRSVAKSRPATNNCIFDCKVLSRNHAILWYEDGKFFLQDTKSSNGTFVNNVRLSKGSEESEPKQIKSGDIVQFGVDVVENSKKVTHGCIVATVTLFLPDGKEATKGGVTRSLFALNENGIQAQEIWQLSQYLQDAMYREQILETLENQLETLTKNLNEDDIKKELLVLQGERHHYEMKAKESLKKVLQEKLEAIQKLTEVEKTCSNAEDECGHYRSLYERSQQELTDLAEKHKQRLQEMQTLQDQVEEAEKRHSAAKGQKASQEKVELELRIKEAELREAALSAKTESLQAECDFTKEQVAAMKVHMEKAKDELRQPNNDVKSPVIQLKEETIISAIDSHENRELEKLPEDFEGSSNGLENPREGSDSNTDDIKILQVQVEKLKDEVDGKEKIVNSLLEQIEETKSLHKDSQNDILLLKEQLDKSKLTSQEDKEKLHSLEEQVIKYHLQAIDELSLPDDSLMDDVEHLNHTEIPLANHDDSHDIDKFEVKNPLEDLDLGLVRRLYDHICEVKSMAEERHLTMIRWSAAEDDDDDEIVANSNGRGKPERERSSFHPIRNARQLLQDSLHDLQDIKGEFIEIGRIIDSEHEESEHVQGQLNETQQELKENSELVVELREELKNAQSCTKDFKQQILDLRDRLLEEQELTRKKEEYVAQLKREVNELAREKDLLTLERKCEHHATETAINNAREMQKQAAKSAKDAGKNKVELSAVSEDNKFLRQRIQILESELKKYRRENNRLTSDQSRLQATYREIENQSKFLSEKIAKQQTTLQGKIEKEITEKKHTEDQASALEGRLRETEGKLKKLQEESQSQIRQLSGANSQLWLYILAGAVGFIAFIAAFVFDIVEMQPGGRVLGLWS